MPVNKEVVKTVSQLTVRALIVILAAYFTVTALMFSVTSLHNNGYDFFTIRVTKTHNNGYDSSQ